MIESCVFVLLLHGAGQTGEDARKFIDDAPNSWQIVSPSSQTGQWDLNPLSSDERTLVNIARGSNCKTKIVAGFSNGGYMSSALLCRHPRLFDASFSVNGFTAAPVCKTNKKSHVYVVSSANDPLVNKNGSVHPWAEQIVPPWARLPAKETVKAMSTTSASRKKAIVVKSKTHKTYSWGNYTWCLEYNKTHEWTENTTKLFIDFIKGVKYD